MKNKTRMAALVVTLSVLSFWAWGASGPTVDFLWTQESASGTLTGPDDQHLKLTLKQLGDYVTRFTDRPLRQATAVANVDFYRRWNGHFLNDPPNAVLSYKAPGSLSPESIVLTLSNPDYNAGKKTVTYDAVRIHRAVTPDLNASVKLQIKDLKTPKSFSACSLFIDSSSGSTTGCPTGPDDQAIIEYFNEIEFNEDIYVKVTDTGTAFSLALTCPQWGTTDIPSPNFLLTMYTTDKLQSITCNTGQITLNKIQIPQLLYCQDKGMTCSFVMILSNKTTQAIYSSTEIMMTFTNGNNTYFPNLNPATLPLCPSNSQPCLLNSTCLLSTTNTGGTTLN